MMPLGNRKNILENLSRSVLLQFKKYRTSENLTFNNLGIFHSLKMRDLMVKSLEILLC